MDDVEARGSHVVITRNGRDSTVIMAHTEYKSLQATLEVLNDPHAMADLAASEADVRAGRLYDWEDVKREDLIGHARRRVAVRA